MSKGPQPNAAKLASLYLAALRRKVIEERAASQVQREIERRRLVPDSLRHQGTMHVLNLAWGQAMSSLSDCRRAIADIEERMLGVEVPDSNA